jgi:hypothetical protein
MAELPLERREEFDRKSILRIFDHFDLVAAVAATVKVGAVGR